MRSIDPAHDGDDGFHMSVQELKSRLDRGEQVTLLDVRRQDERETVHLGGVFIPLDELKERLGELNQEREIVVYCHHGVRSIGAVQYLRANGFSKARNLAGGIDRWSLEVDPSVRRY